jgi:hypothetical protein
MRKCFLLAALCIYLNLSPSKAFADLFVVDQTNQWDGCNSACTGLNVRFLVRSVNHLRLPCCPWMTSRSWLAPFLAWVPCRRTSK